MPTLLPRRVYDRVFDAEDRRVYAAWLRRTVLVYGALVLLGMGVVTFLAVTYPDGAGEFAFDAGAIGMLAP
jgi:hypothetical protein